MSQVGKEELSRALQLVSGGRAAKHQASTDTNPSVVWRIGIIDGQPSELKNGDKIRRMAATWGVRVEVTRSENLQLQTSQYSYAPSSEVSRLLYSAVAQEQSASVNLN
ncbi:hypothetical protein V8F20_011791 [Naviculisporaceae sp. PSN 640]